MQFKKRNLHFKNIICDCAILNLSLNKNIKEKEAMVIFSTISQKIFFDEKQKEKIVIVSPPPLLLLAFISRSISDMMLFICFPILLPYVPLHLPTCFLSLEKETKGQIYFIT